MQFLFNNRSEELYLFVQGILAELCVSIGSENFERIQSNCQLVLIEMLTNALKHSDMPESIIELHIGMDDVQIKRFDFGKPFHWALPGYNTSTDCPYNVILYSDDLFTLTGNFTSPNEMFFEISEHILPEQAFPYNLSEHFGLVIITKASRQFSYHYDEDTGKNTYLVKVGLE